MLYPDQGCSDYSPTEREVAHQTLAPGGTHAWPVRLPGVTTSLTLVAWVVLVPQVVDTVELAVAVAQKLRETASTNTHPLYHAVDTETAFFDVTKQTPCGYVDNTSCSQLV